MKKILIRPLISEKTLKDVNELNKYTFVVASLANKIEIAKAIETKFNVTVNSVNVMNVLGKKVRFGKSREPGLKQTLKKAIVTLKTGDKISVFDIK